MKSRQKKSFWGELFDWSKAIAFGVAAAFAINNLLIVNAKIPSGSMETTIMTGDRVMANRLAYLTQPPERFDVVVFKFPDDETLDFVKRVIGMPGETVEIKSGKVYINGALLDDGAYVNGEPTGNYGPFEVPAYHYFMLGDNRNDSHDSKNWEHPFVEESKITGKVILQYYPHVKILE